MAAYALEELEGTGEILRALTGHTPVGVFVSVVLASLAPFSCVLTGSACASGKEKPSHVLSAMGISPALAARVLRFSSGWETTQDEWQRLLDGVVEAWGALKGAGT